MEQVHLKPGELPEGITVVKFSTPTCGPCRLLTPKFDALDYGDSINLMSINPQIHMEWMTELGLKTVPTTIGFVDNNPVFTVNGNSINEIKEEIEKLT